MIRLIPDLDGGTIKIRDERPTLSRIWLDSVQATFRYPSRHKSFDGSKTRQQLLRIESYLIERLQRPTREEAEVYDLIFQPELGGEGG